MNNLGQRTIQIVEEAQLAVDRLIEEMAPSTAAVWERVARQSYIEGRLAGLEWVKAQT